MSDSGLSDKFNQTYKSFNKLFTYIDNYRASEFNSYASNRLIVLGDLKKEINNLFEQFLKNSSLDSINFNIINFYISDLENVVEGIRVNEDPRRVEKFYGELVDIVEKIHKELRANYSNREINKKIEYLDTSIKDVNELKEQIKNKDTHDIYEIAANENQDRADNSRMAFIILIIFSIIIVWFCSVTKTYFGLKDYDYWFFKGTLILTSVTLITYFLKQSVKYQKIADQCRQTKMELEAFPSFVASFTTEDPQIIEIRKELALKYFGRELDNKTNDETSNILQDQMKNTTEMVKTAMEVLKKTGNS
ncbi:MULTISPECIES: hypothetical protein [Acinetobacter]|uniref:Uncharacterized protein n=4 Tax=Acinetobacter baumannii TaxID=470 RepID=A0A6I4HQL6_ACIBA|nr:MULTISPECIES: hypothetical protein [Acinetobacter]AIL79219.1 hypothetical protein IX87_11475 [Acinetobacter baumannii]AIS07805.1 hypothetical protein LX00_15875 [Acinetobacter baumannii]ANC36689.1 hypothetical protein Aba3207_08645 [Acinetobacter baumannii]APJ18119.1 hypothetical protein BS064_03025 [Acinetobacter baumannii]ATD19982.1 hypothetical protein BS098_08790 [Acinetobacter baumannii]